MREGERTPGPWEAPTAPYRQRDWDGDVFGGGDWEILPPLGEAGPVAIVNSKANAEHIVRAVNAHDALVEALEDITRLCRSDKPSVALSTIIQVKANTALAAARGEEVGHG